MAYILHIDTSAENSLVALAKNGQLLSVITNEDARNHASVLNLHIEKILKENSIALANLAAFCVCGGPGSYTGLRIGMATAKGFCYALDKPLIVQSRLQLIANSHLKSSPTAGIIISILQARQGEYFIAVFDELLGNIKEPQHVYGDDLPEFMFRFSGKILCCGHIDELVKNSLSGCDCEYIESTSINVETWVSNSFNRYKCNDFVNLASSEPLYLKQVYTHKPK